MENQSLILDLIEWVDKKPRSYNEVMEAWRTSCPRLTIWEDAVDRGFVVRTPGVHSTPMVEATRRGRRFLGESGRID